MSSKRAKVIVLPVYVVNIGLLYALLLTSGLMLAWVTIYRHEESIAELRQTLKEIQAEVKRDISSATGEKGDQGQGKLDQDINVYGQKLTAVEDDSDKRSRRHLGSNPRDSKNTEYNRKGKKKPGRKGTRRKRTKIGPKGDKGDKGDVGPRGEVGRRGDEGPRGNTVSGYPGPRGEKGYTGQKGGNGRNGDKGDKGDQGQIGKSIMERKTNSSGQNVVAEQFSQSAHIVARKEKHIKSNPDSGKVHRMTFWKVGHKSGQMSLENGYLTVGVGGYYFIYSQMFYFDGDSAYNSHGMYIDDHRVLRTINSVVNKTRKFHTQYTSGIFKIEKGQTISVGTRVARNYYFNKTSTFFGAFMLHY